MKLIKSLALLCLVLSLWSCNTKPDLSEATEVTLSYENNSIAPEDRENFIFVINSEEIKLVPVENINIEARNTLSSPELFDEYLSMIKAAGKAKMTDDCDGCGTHTLRVFKEKEMLYEVSWNVAEDSPDWRAISRKAKENM